MKRSLKSGKQRNSGSSLNVIKSLGIGQDYLSHETTFNHVKFQSQDYLIDHRRREDWGAGGGKDIYQSAYDKMMHILNTHKPAPLPDDVLASIRSILERS